MAKTTAVRTITLRELNRATLARQMLLAREKKTPLQAIERLFGMQAQSPRPPFVGLWTRLAKFEREDLLGLVERREVVRATLMRVTIHLLSAKDYVRFRAALQPALTAGLRSALGVRFAKLDMNPLLREGRAFFAKEPATFSELRSALVKAHPKADDRAMQYAVRAQVPLVQVPSDAPWGWPGNADFALAETWLGEHDAPKLGDATRELVLRYLAAFGPATVRDAQAWSGHPGLAPVFEELRPELVVLHDEKHRELFDLPKAPRPPADVEVPVRLLPEFDNVLLAHADRTRVLGDVPKSKIFLAAARALATFLIDGMLAGTWRVERTKTKATVVLSPYRTLPKSAQRALEEEASRVGRFVERGAGDVDVKVVKPVRENR